MHILDTLTHFLLWVWNNPESLIVAFIVAFTVAFLTYKPLRVGEVVEEKETGNLCHIVLIVRTVRDVNFHIAYRREGAEELTVVDCNNPFEVFRRI